MAKRKLTTHGTPYLTKQERSEAMRRAWVTRRRKQRAECKRLGLPDPVRSAAIKRAMKARKGPPDPLRSSAIKKAWARRFANGTASRKQKRLLLSKEERSAIARAAAALRKQRAEAAERARLKALKKRKAASKRLREEAAKVVQPVVKARRKRNPLIAPVVLDEQIPVSTPMLIDINNAA